LHDDVINDFAAKWQLRRLKDRNEKQLKNVELSLPQWVENQKLDVGRP
jgi:hypothetical protein